jgi:coatomer subunit beta
MTSVIRVGQSKFVTVPIDEDSSDRILQCVESLSSMTGTKSVKDAFMTDTKAAYAQMLAHEEVRAIAPHLSGC